MDTLTDTEMIESMGICDWKGYIGGKPYRGWHVVSVGCVEIVAERLQRSSKPRNRCERSHVCHLTYFARRPSCLAV